jgi:phosphatidylinositol alpha-1,6-mannosyltransferase
MAAGVPAMASTKDGSREALLDGKLGPLVDPDDMQSVTAGIRAVLSRPKARPEGLDHFSIENFRRRMSNLLDEIQPR